MFPWKKSDTLFVIAHRGSSEFTPENTLTAFKKAILDGADAIELDIRLTKDNELVVIHDSRLERTSNGVNKVENWTLADLKKLDFGSWFDPQFESERIPTLDEVFKTIKKKVGYDIEIKPNVKHPDLILKKCLSLIKQHKLQKLVMISSFEHSIVKKVKTLDKTIATGIIYSPIIHFAEDPVFLAKKYNADAIIVSRNYTRETMIKDAHRENLLFFVYNVEKRKHFNRMINFKVDGIITKTPKSVKNYLIHI